MKSINDTLAYLKALMRPHPQRDWVIISVVLALVFIYMLVSASYLFWGIRSGRIVGVGNPETPAQPKVTRGEIQEVLDVYQVRRTNFDAKNFPERTLVDPAR